MNRRHFLALAGAGLAASDLPAWAARLGPKNVPASDKLELAIATICCDGMGDEDFKYAFEVIPQLGLKNVEFTVWFEFTVWYLVIELSLRDRATMLVDLKKGVAMFQRF